MTARRPWGRAALRLAAVAAGVVAGACTMAKNGPAPGDPAPPFELPGTDGRTHRLADYQGRAVVIAWFPKANTPG